MGVEKGPHPLPTSADITRLARGTGRRTWTGNAPSGAPFTWPIANNGGMALEQDIDDLYKSIPGEFVAARTALAKTLSGDDARRVRALQKPTVAPWAVNQLYWRARPAYDRLAESGKSLRATQVAALKGGASDVRRATDAHRDALAQAVTEAMRLSAAAGVHPNPDELARTLEAISLARELPERAGRLTRALRPAGFEALAGVTVKPGRAAPSEGRAKAGHGPAKAGHYEQVEMLRRKPDSNRAALEKKRAEAERRKQKEIESVSKMIARAKAEEERKRGAWERARRKVAEAELRLSALQK